MYDDERTSAASLFGGIPLVSSFINSVMPAMGLESGLRDEQMNAIDKQSFENRKNAIWNLNYITKPVFQMEAEEWDRRFNEMNEWNSPANKIKLMKEGHLNPAMLQGETGITDATSPAVNEAGAAYAESPDIARLQTAKAESNLKEKQAIGVGIDNITKGIANWGNIKLTNAQVQVAKSQAKWNEEDLGRIKSMCRMLDEQAAQLKQFSDESKKRIDEIDEKIKLYVTQRRVNDANAELMGKQGDVLEEQKDSLFYENDLIRNSMHSQDPKTGAYYYDPVNSFYANWWKRSKIAALNKTLAETKTNQFQQNFLRNYARYMKTAADLNDAQIPILKIQGGIQGMKFNFLHDTYDARKENVLGTLSLQNGVLSFKSETMPFDYWIGWGQGKLKQGLELLDIVDQFKHNWIVHTDNMLDRMSKISGILSGKPQAGQPATQSYRENDMWDNTNTGGYDFMLTP